MDFLRSVPLWLKVLGPVGALVVGLMTVGADWVGLPAQVRENTDSIRAHTDYIDDTEGEYDRIICLLTLPNGMTPLEAEQECP